MGIDILPVQLVNTTNLTLFNFLNIPVMEEYKIFQEQVLCFLRHTDHSYGSHKDDAYRYRL